MIIADTSSWVDHFRHKETPLRSLLKDARILLHPFVMGELLLHDLPKRGEAAKLLETLDPAPLATPAEVAAMIGWAKLAGKGIGYVDAHLLMSAKMTQNGRVLTQDRKLLAQAKRLQIAYAP